MRLMSSRRALLSGNAELKVKPTLDLDFLSGTLDPRITFTRSTTGTRFNSAGALETVAINGPRIDYDPVTLADKGLLIEEQRTNSIRNNMMVGAVAGTPGTLPTNWGRVLGGITQTVVGTGVENGITYIDVRFNGTTTGTSLGVRFESNVFVATAPGQTWAASVFCRLVGGSTSNISTVTLHVQGLNASGTSNTDSYSKSLMSVLNVSSLAQTRTSAVFTFADATTAFSRPQVAMSFVVGAAIDITLRIGMPQFEQGAFATSTIPTSGAVATRSMDVAVMTGTNFSSWYNAVEGTLISQYDYNTTSILNLCAFSLDDGTSGNTIVNATATPNIDRVLATAGGASQANFGNFSYAVGQVVKRAVAVKLNDAATTANGSAVSTDNAFVMPSPTQLVIGAAGYFSTSRINGHIRRITYYPRRLSDKALQKLTQ